MSHVLETSKYDIADEASSSSSSSSSASTSTDLVKKNLKLLQQSRAQLAEMEKTLSKKSKKKQKKKSKQDSDTEEKESETDTFEPECNNSGSDDSDQSTEVENEIENGKAKGKTSKKKQTRRRKSRSRDTSSDKDSKNEAEDVSNNPAGIEKVDVRTDKGREQIEVADNKGKGDKEQDKVKDGESKVTSEAKADKSESDSLLCDESSEIKAEPGPSRVGIIRVIPLSQLMDTSKPAAKLDKSVISISSSDENVSPLKAPSSSNSNSNSRSTRVRRQVNTTSYTISSSSSDEDFAPKASSRKKRKRSSSSDDVPLLQRMSNRRDRKRGNRSGSENESRTKRQRTQNPARTEKRAGNQINGLANFHMRKVVVRLKRYDLTALRTAPATVAPDRSKPSTSKSTSSETVSSDRSQVEKTTSKRTSPVESDAGQSGQNGSNSKSAKGVSTSDKSPTTHDQIPSQTKSCNDDDNDVVDDDNRSEEAHKNTDDDSADSDSDTKGINRMAGRRKAKKPVIREDSAEEEDDVQLRQKSGNESESGGNTSNYKQDSDSSASEVQVKTTKGRRRAKRSSSSEKSESSGAKNRKKRRRIKGGKNDDSSDDDDNESPKKRKNIRKVIKTKDLDDDTKRAAREEEERRKRIEERQKMYNDIYETADSVELTELVLDFEEETKEPLLKVDSGILKQLKPHQATGIKFMWDACFETLKDCNEKPGSGCILAHCMGLGKTLQVITLTHTLLTNSKKTGVERVLIISPLSTLSNWAREYVSWMKFSKNRNIEIYDMSKFKDKATRIFKLGEWYEEGGVCIVGYDMYRILSNEKSKGLRKKQRETLQKSLVNPGPDLVVCDEGHLLKNEKTSLSQAVSKIRTQRRIVLTGTPLQNNLKEYYCMIQFIKPNLLGTYKEYLNRFVNPITNGQYTDSTERDIRLMKQRSHILHKLLEGCIQRRDYSVLAPYLPPKHEYVVHVSLSDIQKKVYEFYMGTQREVLVDASSGSKGATLFQDFQNLRRIWTHPMCLRVNSDTVIKKKLLKDDDSEGSLKDFIDDDDDSNDSSDTPSDSFDSDASEEKPVKKITRANRNSADLLEPEVVLEQKEDASEWWMKMVSDDELNDIRNSPKLMLLLTLIQECEKIGDKILVFSQSLQSLDVIEHFLSLIDRKTNGEEIDGNVGDFYGQWVPNVDYFRLDGSRSVENREQMCKTFNNKTNLRSRLFLISTRAGGLGINLVAANRVVIFDVSWNPSHDTQSIFRVYRFGQEKPCYIYRLIAMGTMEQKVYERQVIKQATAKRVIDEQQISRHYNQSDLQELYSYELTPKVDREIPILPKDRLFADMLRNYEKLIFKYHEHDSLLENEEGEHLTEEERKAAWLEYEQEKTRPAQTSQYVAYNRQAYGNFGNPNGSVTSNKIYGFRTDVLLQLLQMKISIDNPALSREQIITLVPSYLNALHTQMNSGNPTFYKELLDLHKTLEMPHGMYMNPLLAANQNPIDQRMVVNPYATALQSRAGIPQTSHGSNFNANEVYEID